MTLSLEKYSCLPHELTRTFMHMYVMCIQMSKNVFKAIIIIAIQKWNGNYKIPEFGLLLIIDVVLRGRAHVDELRMLSKLAGHCVSKVHGHRVRQWHEALHKVRALIHAEKCVDL